MMSPLPYDHYMRHAISVAGRNPQNPFGAILVDARAGEIVSEGVNQTMSSPLLHGEVDAIQRYAARSEGGWSRLTLYTTAEPCPMCQGAILWAGIRRVVFGTAITTLRRLGWSQIMIPALEIVARSPFECDLIGGLLEAECDTLFERAAEVRHSSGDT